jgi:hypothetical protein
MINFPQANDHPHSPGKDLFVGSVIIRDTRVGTWRRTFQSQRMIMEIVLAPDVLAESWGLVEAAAADLAAFARKDLELTITG